jgi:hypothetical protein
MLVHGMNYQLDNLNPNLKRIAFVAFTSVQAAMVDPNRPSWLPIALNEAGSIDNVVGGYRAPVPRVCGMWNRNKSDSLP